MSLVGVWIALLSLLLSVGMVLHRPLFNDLSILLVLYFGAPGAMCLAGLVLWAHRKEGAADTGLQARRMQCKIAIGLALAAAAIVYALVMLSDRVAKPSV